MTHTVQQRKNQTWLTEGDRGARVLNAEMRLEKLGYDVGKVDGVFDADTARAVRAFKRDQPAIRKYAQGRYLGDVGQRILRNEVKALQHAPRRVERDLTKRTKADDRLVGRAARNGGIREGDSGHAVEVVQRHLKAAGFDPKHTNGVFDERTAGVLKAFQKRAGLPETGVVGPRTWRALKQVTIENDGRALSREVMKDARRVGNEINRTGGYRFDGTNDCWGFVRRVLNPNLKAKGLRELPVADAGTPSGRRNWDAITDWKKIPVGTPLSTHEGHAWGAQWHGGIFAGVKNGVPMIYDCSGSRDGAYLRPMPPGLFKYFYAPAAKALD
jgi:peptidoglycan hydrolase-like protein with peptidoglycan-binding domain